MRFTTIFFSELLKLRRARIVGISLLAYGVGPLIGALFMIILKDPELGRRIGLVGAKARVVAAAADWPTYLSMMLQLTGVAGMILIGVISAYVFGREYAEGTAKNMLGLPIPRARFVTSKIMVIALWFAALTVAFWAELVLVAVAVGLPGFSQAGLAGFLAEEAKASALILLLIPVPGFVAVASRGYLAPLGATIFTMILGMVFGATGWGVWVPWSIVPISAGVAGPESQHLVGPGSYAVLLALFVAGTAATMIHLTLADNSQ
jgi:ABC-2 type transport system permease protein